VTNVWRNSASVLGNPTELQYFLAHTLLREQYQSDVPKVGPLKKAGFTDGGWVASEAPPQMREGLREGLDSNRHDARSGRKTRATDLL